MPILDWKEKHLSPPTPATVILDSTLYPKGRYNKGQVLPALCSFFVA